MDRDDLDFEEIEPTYNFNNSGKAIVSNLIYNDVKNIKTLDRLYDNDINEIDKDLLFSSGNYSACCSLLREIRHELTEEYIMKRKELEMLEPSNVGLAKLSTDLFPEVKEKKEVKLEPIKTKEPVLSIDMNKDRYNPIPSSTFNLIKELDTMSSKVEENFKYLTNEDILGILSEVEDKTL